MRSAEIRHSLGCCVGGASPLLLSRRSRALSLGSLCFPLKAINLVATWGRCFGCSFGGCFPATILPGNNSPYGRFCSEKIVVSAPQAAQRPRGGVPFRPQLLNRLATNTLVRKRSSNPVGRLHRPAGAFGVPAAGAAGRWKRAAAAAGAEEEPEPLGAGLLAPGLQLPVWSIPLQGSTGGAGDCVGESYRTSPSLPRSRRGYDVGGTWFRGS